MAAEIVMPRLSDSMEEGTIVRWLVAEGDRVEPGQPLVEIETDKATVTHEADAPGVILSLRASEGASLAVGALIALVGEAGESVPEPVTAVSGEAAVAGARRPAGGVERTLAAVERTPAAVERTPAAVERTPAAVERTPAAVERTPAAVERTAAAAQGSPRARRPKASPLARRLAAEQGVDLAALSGSGPNGRVIRADVELAAGGGEDGKASPQQPAKGRPEPVQLSRLQQTIARRMSESRATVPDLELRIEVDMTEAVALRERLREVADPAPSYNDFIVKAVALALREVPRVNAAYRDGALETYPRVNIGIAVAAEDALLVPTIFDADKASLGSIATTSKALAARGREGTLNPAELSGGTFTISNLGMYGIDSFSAVINPPQAAILAVGSLKRRAVVDQQSGAISARPTMMLALACDHRIVYGADGARFLGRVRELLERPHALLL